MSGSNSRFIFQLLALRCFISGLYFRFRFQIAIPRFSFQVLDFRFSSSGFGFQILDFRLRFSRWAPVPEGVVLYWGKRARFLAGGSGLGHRWPWILKKLSKNPLGKPSLGIK